VPRKAAADHCGTSLRVIETNCAKFISKDRARHAALAAPALRLHANLEKITLIRRAEVA
jgi:hypothetical protein